MEPLRIGLTTPFAHPYVRRGVERVVAELAEWLDERGHRVTVMSSAPDTDRDAPGPGGVTLRYRRAGGARGRGRLRVDEALATAPAIARGMRGLELDVVQHHHQADAAGVWLARLGRPLPSVFWLSGVPRQRSLGGRPLSRLAAVVAFASADRLHVLSRHAALALREEFGREAEIVPPGVRTERYGGPRPAQGPPVVLCAAAADDRRKRVELLLRAWPLVLRRRPEARLSLVTPRPEAARGLLTALDEAARRTVAVGSASPEEMPAHYRAATVSVLPSLDEGFGLVVVESLAAGTPVVGTAHGAIPEILDDDGVGRLFPPDDEQALARAIVDALELAADPGAVERCRAHAKRWDWDAVGPLHEAAYHALLTRSVSP